MSLSERKTIWLSTKFPDESLPALIPPICMIESPTRQDSSLFNSFQYLMDGSTVLYQEPALNIRFEEEECSSTRKCALFEALTRSNSNVRLPIGLKGSEDLMWSHSLHWYLKPTCTVLLCSARLPFEVE